MLVDGGEEWREGWNHGSRKVEGERKGLRGRVEAAWVEGWLVGKGYEDGIGHGCLLLFPLGKTKGLGVSFLDTYLQLVKEIDDHG